MKTYILLSAVYLMLFVLSGCKKDGPPPAAITGRWNVVSDSTYTGVGLGNQLVVYTGKTGDYFNFISDNKLYTSESAVRDTLTYRFLSTKEIVLTPFGATINGIQDTSIIRTFSSNRLVIASKTLFTPAGIFGRVITLSR